jgi:uncharacterized protein (TIRG00374 family)
MSQATPETSLEPPAPNSKFSAMVWVGFGISILFLGIFFRGTDWGALREAFQHADYTYIFPAILLALGSYPLRAYRWYYLLPRTEGSTFRNRLNACLIGFMANNIFPLRAGEFIRVGVFSLKSKIPVGTVLASLVLERLLDLIVVLLALGVVLFELPGQLGAESAHHLALAKTTGMIFGVLVLAILTFLVLLRLFPAQMTALTERCVDLLPAFLASKIRPQVEAVFTGLSAISGPVAMLWLIFLSIIHWAVPIYAIWVLAHSFDLHLNYLGALLIFVFTSLSVAVPQAPGFVGVFQVAVQASLALLGSPTNAARGFALVQWAVSIAPVTVVGFAVMSMEGFSLSEVRRLEAH